MFGTKYSGAGHGARLADGARAGALIVRRTFSFSSAASGPDALPTNGRMESHEIEITDLSHDGRGSPHRRRRPCSSRRIARRTCGIRSPPPSQLRRSARRDAADAISPSASSRVVRTSASRRVRAAASCRRAQIAAKQRVLAENFERIGKVAPQSGSNRSADAPWGYRRKGGFRSNGSPRKEDKVLVGFREDNRAFRRGSFRLPHAAAGVGLRLRRLSRARHVARLAQYCIAQVEISAVTTPSRSSSATCSR